MHVIVVTCIFICSFYRKREVLHQMDKSCLMVTKTTILYMKVKVMFILQLLEDVTIGFFVKVIATIEDFKTQTIVLKESVGCSETILAIEIHAGLSLLQVIAFFI